MIGRIGSGSTTPDLLQHSHALFSPSVGGDVALRSDLLYVPMEILQEKKYSERLIALLKESGVTF
jgi:hypothetical protein